MFKEINQMARKWKAIFYATFYKPAQFTGSIKSSHRLKNLVLSDWILQFHNRYNKTVIKIPVLQFRSEIIISNETRAASSFYFKITSLICTTRSLITIILQILGLNYKHNRICEIKTCYTPQIFWFLTRTQNVFFFLMTRRRKKP